MSRFILYLISNIIILIIVVFFYEGSVKSHFNKLVLYFKSRNALEHDSNIDSIWNVTNVIYTLIQKSYIRCCQMHPRIILVAMNHYTKLIILLDFFPFDYYYYYFNPSAISLTHSMYFLHVICNTVWRPTLYMQMFVWASDTIHANCNIYLLFDVLSTLLTLINILIFFPYFL